MNEHADNTAANADEQADDRLIRQAAAAWTPAGPAPQIEARVFARISRRRQMLWGSLSALAATALLGAGLFWHNHQMHNPPEHELAARPAEDAFAPDIEVVSIGGVPLGHFATESPVVEFEVVAQSQHAIVELLRALGEE